MTWTVTITPEGILRGVFLGLFIFPITAFADEISAYIRHRKWGRLARLFGLFAAFWWVPLAIVALAAIGFVEVFLP